MKYPLVILGLVSFFAGQGSLVLPVGNDAWLVEVSTTGGFFGSGTRAIAVSSAGQVICSSPAMHCPRDVAVSDIKPLVEMVPHGHVTISTRSIVGFCSDCVSRTIVVRHRDNLGVLHTYTASWDDLSASVVSREVMKLYESVLTLSR